MNLVCSFSGGETSALMTRLCLTEWRDRWDEVIVLFANTGEENEETLAFVERCDKAFGFNVVWLEAEINPEYRKGTTHRVVSFEAASRGGEPYKELIKKYGIPNAKFPHCTRELKLRPIQSYVKSLGWSGHQTSIGIRSDEAHRRGDTPGVIYPLLDFQPTTKPMVNAFWSRQPFRLNLAGYQGNCKWCWKKSTRKLLTILDESPEAFNFPEAMEAEYGLIGAEFKKQTIPGYRRTFFRGNLSVADLKSMLIDRRDTLDRAEDDSLDIDDGCAESCELDFSDSAAASAAR